MNQMVTGLNFQYAMNTFLIVVYRNDFLHRSDALYIVAYHVTFFQIDYLWLFYVY